MTHDAPIDLEALKVPVDLLAKLLAEPEPGILAWQAMVRQTIAMIRNITELKPANAKIPAR